MAYMTLNEIAEAQRIYRAWLTAIPLDLPAQAAMKLARYTQHLEREVARARVEALEEVGACIRALAAQTTEQP